MEIFNVTKELLNAANEYIGETDLSNWHGHIHIAENIGFVKFECLVAKGRVFANAGSGIEAGLGIEAGEGIEAGWGIKAGLGIKAGEGIKAGLGIEAGEGIKARWGIKAGEGIKAGLGIEAGEGIEARWGIEAGWGIVGKFLNVQLRIFAGLCMHRLPTPQQLEIRAELRKGTVCLGTLIEPSEKVES